MLPRATLTMMAFGRMRASSGAEIKFSVSGVRGQVIIMIVLVRSASSKCVLPSLTASGEIPFRSMNKMRIPSALPIFATVFPR
jgi:hypothetical protein